MKGKDQDLQYSLRSIFCICSGEIYTWVSTLFSSYLLRQFSAFGKWPAEHYTNRNTNCTYIVSMEKADNSTRPHESRYNQEEWFLLDVVGDFWMPHGLSVESLYFYGKQTNGKLDLFFITDITIHLEGCWVELGKVFHNLHCWECYRLFSYLASPFE